MEIVGKSGALALIDITGDGVAEDAVALAQVGIDDAEREHLLLVLGSSGEFWRTEVEHFSAWDLNWGVLPPESAEAASGYVRTDLDDQSIQCGSIIECESQGLGETLPVAGTGLTMNWRSTRVAGGPAWRTKVQLTDDMNEAAFADLVAIRAWGRAAGAAITSEHPPTSNLEIELAWDGLDAYGRPVQGATPFEVCVGYDYPLVYARSGSPSSTKFGYSGNGKYAVGVLGSRATLTRCFGRVPIGTGGNTNALGSPRKLLIGGLDARQASDGLGGWTLSNHHTYAKEAGVVYYGTGSRRDVGQGLLPFIETYAGNNSNTGPLHGGDRLDVRFPSNVTALAVAPDGDLYVGYAGQIVRVERDDGLVHPFAGTGTQGFGGDGGVATSAQIKKPTGIDLGPDGSVYFLDAGNYRIRRVDPAGTITTVAGRSAASTAKRIWPSGRRARSTTWHRSRAAT